MTDNDQVLLESQAARNSLLAIETLALLPAPTESAPPLTERNSLRKLINAWCRSNNIEHEKAWRVLYAELYIRDGFSVNARIKNSKATSKLELVAEHGKLGILYAIATEIFKVQSTIQSIGDKNQQNSQSSKHGWSYSYEGDDSDL
jgi:hypothetical protein